VLEKAPIAVNGDTWLTLPGGKDQAIPKINPLAIFAQNAGATNGLGGDYEMRFDNGQVLTEYENMRWEFDTKDAIVIQGLGIKAGANLGRTGLRIASDYHPKGMTDPLSLIPTSVGINPLNYGFMSPFMPANIPIYVSVPKLDKSYLIWNEIGGVVIRDDTVGVVAANAIRIALTGLRIEMRS
jgi:hypothetical protein